MLNIGILGCAEIAFRRFMPAAREISDLCVKVVAEEYDATKLDAWKNEYQVDISTSFDEVINRDDIDAVYIPQPPALHYEWARKSLEAGKHVLVEKPSTTSLSETTRLAELARSNGLALYENYMFIYHSQIGDIKKLIEQGEIGDIRLIRADFGFPMRASNDFRYIKKLGGGALIDAGGYTAKIATAFLGNTIKVDTATLNGLEGFEVDMYGSASFSNAEGQVCQVAFGMDNQYRCALEVWGSKGRLTTGRIFTAPPAYNPVVTIETAEGSRNITLQDDAHFGKSIQKFMSLVSEPDTREDMYDTLIRQAKLVEDMRGKGNL